MRHLRTLFAVVLALSSVACTSRYAEEPPFRDDPAQEPTLTDEPFTLEIVNPMPHTMNVVYWVGGSQTTLGAVGANETKRFQLPNRGNDTVRLTATDQGQTHTVEETMDLDKGEVIRWVIGQD